MYRKTILLLLTIASILVVTNTNAQCPKAQKYIDKVEDANKNWTPDQRARDKCPQGWSQLVTWHVYKCQCEKGVETIEDAKKLAGTMNSIRQTIVSQYPGCGETPPTIRYSDCKINSAGGGTSGSASSGSKDKFSIYEDKLIDAKTKSYINLLAERSNNPKLKTFASALNDIDEVNQKVARYNNMFNLTPSQADIEFNNVMNNAMQGVATAKFIISLFQEEEVEMTPSQKQARNSVLKIRDNVRMIYNETKVIPFMHAYDRNDLQKLEELESSYLSYDIATAADRYLLIRYFSTSKRYNTQEVQNIYNDIQAMKTIDILRRIDTWQQTAKVGAAMFLPNSDYSLKMNKNLINIKRARCYRNMGDNKKADEILASIDFGIPYTEAIKLMKESFEAGDYETTASFYPIVKSHFENETTPKIRYYIDLDKSNNYKSSKGNGGVGNDFVISRSDVVKLLASGVYAYIISEDYSQAANELEFLEKYIKNKPTAGNYTKIHANEEEVILLSMKASNYILTGKSGEANEFINKAVDLEKTLPLATYKAWVLYVKFRILAFDKKYDEAHALYRELNRMPLLANKKYTAFINIELLKFEKCKILYEQKEYDRVLHGLNILEASTPLMKYKALRAKVYLAQGKKDEAYKELSN